jgi:hypothetical protein
MVAAAVAVCETERGLGPPRPDAVVKVRAKRLYVWFRLARSRDKPGWRNWQTQRTQNPPGFGPWGFDPPSRHQDSNALGT